MDIFEGEIEQFFDRGIAGYGFIRYNNGAKVDTCFFNYPDVVPNNVGDRGFARIVGNLVRFRPHKYLYKGAPTVKAIDIRPVFSTDVEKPEEYRQISVVHNLLRDARGQIVAAFLLRENGEELFLSRRDCGDLEKYQFQGLRVGHHVWHGVQPPFKGDRTWRAAFAEFYSHEEEEGFEQEELCWLSDEKPEQEEEAEPAEEIEEWA